MDRIEDLMIELDGANQETVKRIAWEKGSLPVRLAMLGLAAIRKGESLLWWGNRVESVPASTVKSARASMAEMVKSRAPNTPWTRLLTVTGMASD